MQSIMVYGMMFTSCVLLANRAKRTQEKGYLIAIILALTFVCGCRKRTVGSDTISYYRICQNIVLTGENIYYGMEKGFEYYCRAVLTLIPSPQFFLFLTALITFTLVICRLWEMREIAEFDWMVAGFIVFFYTFLLSGIRQGLALAIVFWGTRFLEQKKYVWYAGCVVLAATFHKTAIVAFASLFWELRRWRQLSKKNRYFMLLCILAVPVAGTALMQNYSLKHYSRFIELSAGKRVLAESVFGFFSLIAFEFDDRYVVHRRYRMFSRESYSNLRAELHQKIATVKVYYIIGLLTQATGYVSSTFSRIGLYWYWFAAVFMGMMVKSKVNQKIFKVMFFLFLIYLCYADSKRNGYNQLPYQFFWQE